MKFRGPQALNDSRGTKKINTPPASSPRSQTILWNPLIILTPSLRASSEQHLSEGVEAATSLAVESRYVSELYSG